MNKKLLEILKKSKKTIAVSYSINTTCADD